MGLRRRSVQDRHSRTAEGCYLVTDEVHVALLHLVSLKPLEAEARQIAGTRRDAAEGHAGHTLHGIGRDEGASLVHVLGEAHIADRRGYRAASTNLYFPQKIFESS